MKNYKNILGKSGGNLLKLGNLEICFNTRFHKELKAISRFSKEIWGKSGNLRISKAEQGIREKSRFPKENLVILLQPLITKG